MAKADKNQQVEEKEQEVQGQQEQEQQEVQEQPAEEQAGWYCEHAHRVHGGGDRT